VAVLLSLPESPAWLASRNRDRGDLRRAPLRALISRRLLPTTLGAILVASIPMAGAWSASKWMIPWADKVAGMEHASYKAVTQGWWAAGSVIGSFLGAQLVGWLGRRVSYVAISIAATAATWAMFQLTEPLRPSFLPVVFVQGFVSTLFFGWLAVYLPELFPVEVRASGSGLAYNSGRFITAAGVLGSAWLFTSLGGDYPRVGSLLGLVYALGIAAIWLAPAGPSPTEFDDGGVQRVGR